MKYGLIIIIAVLTGCTDENLDTNQVSLDGKWIDVNTKTDTLTFELFGDQESMILGRGKEMRDGFLLPKIDSGNYDYKLSTEDKISLRWTLSSNSDFNDYYFKQSGDKLTIEKFFDTSSSGNMLIFEKLN